MQILNNLIGYIEEYGVIVAAVILVAFGVGIKIRNLIKGNLVEWLIDKVGMAEAYFGSQAGQLKLRSVYDAFVKERPILAGMISFNNFSKLVDMALDKFEYLLENDNKFREWYEKDKPKDEDVEKTEDIAESTAEVINE